ncbi:MAG: hypothetical protein JWP12_3478 [Bacteroidetes bacterium]|nr:hypothetical protein [Bacteroidota bacterium]
MKLSTTFVCAITLLFTFNACKRDKDETPVPAATTATYDNYSNLKVGNYWIYQTYNLDTIGNVVGIGEIDSCYVEKDSIFNGHTFQKIVDVTFTGTSTPPASYFYLLRDSLSYTVDALGKVVFSSTDFSSSFNHYFSMTVPLDTFAEIHSNMLPGMESKVVPAGFFNTLDFRTTYDMYPHYSYGTGIRYAYSWYAKNIGLVARRDPAAYQITASNEKRLIRYHLN